MKADEETELEMVRKELLGISYKELGNYREALNY